MNQISAKVEGVAIRADEALGWGFDPLHEKVEGTIESYGAYKLVFGVPASRVEGVDAVLVENPRFLKDLPDSFPVPRAALLRKGVEMLLTPLNQAVIVDGDFARLPNVPLSDLVGRSVNAVFPDENSGLERLSGHFIALAGDRVVIDTASGPNESPFRYLEFTK